MSEQPQGSRRQIEINGRRIGPGQPIYIVAELSANHRGRLGDALRLVECAGAAGADAVKLQTYTADTLTLDSDADAFRVKGSLWNGRTLHDLYREASTPWEWHPQLRAAAHEAGLDLFSTVFDPSSLAFLEELGVPAYKIASFEIVDLPLIEAVARTGKPVIISTGMATFDEIEDAVHAVRSGGNEQIALLECTSAYPAEPSAMNLRTIEDLARSFDVPVGLSDHSLELAVPVAAVALGACIVEKHLTLSRAAGGPDAAFSLEPDELGELVRAIRITEQALGEVRYGPSEDERTSLAFRRSLFAIADIAAGEELTTANVRSIRPGHGLPPKHLAEVLGRRAATPIPGGTPLHWELLE